MEWYGPKNNRYDLKMKYVALALFGVTLKRVDLALKRTDVA